MPVTTNWGGRVQSPRISPSSIPARWSSTSAATAMGPRSRRPLDGQLELFSASAKRKHRVPRGSSYPPGYFDHTIAVLDAIEAQRKGLKPFEGRCLGCGKVISAKARTCGRRTCPAGHPTWKHDQPAVVREALNEYGGLLLLTDVTLPGTPEQEPHKHS